MFPSPVSAPGQAWSALTPPFQEPWGGPPAVRSVFLKQQVFCCFFAYTLDVNTPSKVPGSLQSGLSPALPAPHRATIHILTSLCHLACEARAPATWNAVPFSSTRQTPILLILKICMPFGPLILYLKIYSKVKKHKIQQSFCLQRCSRYNYLYWYRMRFPQCLPIGQQTGE